MISIVAVKCDFATLFSVNRNFHYVFVIFDNRHHVINDRDRDRTVDPCCDDVVGLVFGSLTFGQPAFHPLFRLFRP